MTFGLEPPKNVTNWFGNWLKGIPKDDPIQIRVEVCAIIWAIWNTRNDLVFNNPKIPFLAGYLYGYPLDPYMVLSPTKGTKGAEGVDGFWVQPFRDGSTGFTQPVQMAVA
jgi:hypothetical protein